MNTELILKDECYAVMGACFEVYKVKGCGFLEAVYQECLEREFALRGVPFVAQVEHSLSYKGAALRQTYRSDFVCFGSVLVELKAVSEIADEHRAQLINYLHATGLRAGLLVNFGHHPMIEWQKIVA